MTPTPPRVGDKPEPPHHSDWCPAISRGGFLCTRPALDGHNLHVASGTTRIWDVWPRQSQDGTA